MAMGKRRQHAKQATMWVATQDLPRTAGHPFYARLNQILDRHDFDEYVEELCERFMPTRSAGPVCHRDAISDCC
jgi:transposase